MLWRSDVQRVVRNSSEMPASVLICDDDAQLRRLLSVVFGRLGYELREAADGHATLEALASRQPDLVVLDLHMPGPNGLAILDSIRANPELASTRVLLLSGERDALDEDWAEKVGADAHLPKPFAVRTLEASVRSLLGEEGPPADAG